MGGGEISGELSGEGKRLSWILYFQDLDLEEMMLLGIQSLLMESKLVEKEKIYPKGVSFGKEESKLVGRSHEQVKSRWWYI